MIKRVFESVLKRVDPIRHARWIGVSIGENCRLLDVQFSTEPYLIQIGDHVSATKTRFETHDGGVWVMRDRHPDIDIVKPILVGNNVYFGYGCIVLPGVVIGDNVVVGAGSIVSRDIPSGSVAVGVPARVIRTLDEYESKALEVGLRTKRLTAEEKRSYLKAKYLGGADV